MEKTPYASIEDVIKRQRDQFDLIQKSFILVQNIGDDRKSFFNEFQTKVKQNQELVEKLKHENDLSKQLQKQAENLLDFIKYLEKKSETFGIVIANTNKDEKLPLGEKHSECGNGGVPIDDIKQDTLQSCSSSTSCNDGITPISQNYQNENPESVLKPIQPLKLFQNITVEYEISELTPDEFKCIPAYMRRTIPCSAIESLICDMNKTFKIKYTLLSQTKASLHKPKDIQSWTIFKNNESKGTKGYFITAADITRETGRKIDKQTLLIFPILRHLQKIRQDRMGNVIRYFIA